MSHKGLCAFVTLHCERPWVIDFLLASKEHWHFHGLKMDTVQMRKALGDRTPSFWNNEILSLNSRAHTDTLFNLQPLLRPPEAVQQYPIVSHWPHLLIMSTQEVLCLRKHLTTAHFWWVWTWGYINQTSRSVPVLGWTNVVSTPLESYFGRQSSSEKELWELLKQHDQIGSKIIQQSSVRQHISSLPAEGRQQLSRQLSTFVLTHIRWACAGCGSKWWDCWHKPFKNSCIGLPQHPQQKKKKNGFILFNSLMVTFTYGCAHAFCLPEWQDLRVCACPGPSAVFVDYKTMRISREKTEQTDYTAGRSTLLSRELNLWDKTASGEKSSVPGGEKSSNSARNTGNAWSFMLI